MNFVIIISSASPLPPSPATHLPALRRSPRETKGNPLLPLHPLDIRVGASQPRGTKRSAAIAAHIDEPDRDQDSESVPRKAAVSSRRRVRFQSPLESRPTKRRQVINDLETTEAATDDMWVAVGEVGLLR